VIQVYFSSVSLKGTVFDSDVVQMMIILVWWRLNGIEGEV